jgi:hypothetical protein
MPLLSASVCRIVRCPLRLFLTACAREDAEVGEADLAGAGEGAADDEAGVGDGGVRGAEGVSSVFRRSGFVRGQSLVPGNYSPLARVGAASGAQASGRHRQQALAALGSFVNATGVRPFFRWRQVRLWYTFLLLVR